jgi:hypothetical protein
MMRPPDVGSADITADAEVKHGFTVLMRGQAAPPHDNHPLRFHQVPGLVAVDVYDRGTCIFLDFRVLPLLAQLAVP